MSLTRRFFLGAAAVAAAVAPCITMPAPVAAKPTPRPPVDVETAILDMVIAPPLKVRLHYVNDGLDRKAMSVAASGRIESRGMAFIDFVAPATGTVSRIALYREGDAYDLLTIYEPLHLTIGTDARITVSAEGVTHE